MTKHDQECLRKQTWVEQDNVERQREKHGYNMQHLDCPREYTDCQCRCHKWVKHKE